MRRRWWETEYKLTKTHKRWDQVQVRRERNGQTLEGGTERQHEMNKKATFQNKTGITEQKKLGS